MTRKIDRLRATRALLCAGVAALFAGTASAAPQAITGTLNTSAAFSATNQSADGVTYYNAPYAGALPAAPVVVGGFDFTVPAGEVLSGATLSGDFGSNVLGSGTAEVDLFANGVQVASCDSACAAATQSSDVDWSFSFTPSELSALADGSLVRSAVQQGVSQIVLDPTSVTLATSAVPESGDLPLMLLALPLVAAGLRRRA